MKIVCPNCDNENQFDLTAKVQCSECGEDISNHTYKKTTLSGVAILTIGILGGQFVDYAVTDNRYPLNVEYAVMKSCVNSYVGYLSNNGYVRKESLCLCALEGTMNEISYIRYKVDEKGFSKAFRENVQACRE
jgi:ribosomal protein S27E